MAAIVYTLCALTSLACAVLLLRGYRESRVRLLLWSGLCFIGFALNNTILILDRLVYPDVNFSFYRHLPVLAGLVVLIYGMIWDTQ